MVFSKHFGLLALVFSTAGAFSFPEISRPDASLFTRALSNLFAKRQETPGTCPPVWGDIASELSTLFLDTTTAECNDDARATIRAMFHDCGTWSIDQGETGGCDGSLILAEEFTRPENQGLENISRKLLELALKWEVGVGDMIVFAASVAVVTCPLGPVTTTFVGRPDSRNPAPPGMLPLDMHAKPDFLLELFQNKSMNARELAALVGAHATSRSFHQTPPGRGDIGLPQDSTPGVWDVNFYAETTNPPEGVFVFDSDLALSQHAVVGPEFNAFVGRQGRWNAAFVRAMTKMSLFGVPGGSANLTDCTEFIPQGTRKRDIRSAPINDRVR